jgi:hypothetical protein
MRVIAARLAGSGAAGTALVYNYIRIRQCSTYAASAARRRDDERMAQRRGGRTG